jgi:Uncharacterised protein conserved in bacteria (DUF2336)
VIEKALTAGAANATSPERDAAERRDAALVGVAASCGRMALGELTRVLRARGALTMALLLRALLSGERDLFAQALAELAGISSARAAGLARARGEAFSALMRQAGLPPHAGPAFRAALTALDAQGSGEGEGLRPALVSATIAACEARRDAELQPIVALLWRFAAEAAKAEARDIASEARRPPASLPPKLAFTPANDAGRRLLLAAPTRRVA